VGTFTVNGIYLPSQGERTGWSPPANENFTILDQAIELLKNRGTVGKQDDNFGGLVRGDVRAFKVGTGADYTQAFIDGFNAVQVLYCPPGTVVLGSGGIGVDVPDNKVLWAEGIAAGNTTHLLAGASMTSLVRINDYSGIYNIVADATNLATQEFESNGDDWTLSGVRGYNGLTYGIKIAIGGGRAHIYNCNFGIPSSRGAGSRAFYKSNTSADLQWIGGRPTGGEYAMETNGPDCEYALLHAVAGMSSDPTLAPAVLKVNGSGGKYLGIYYDSAQRMIDVLGPGNVFAGMLFVHPNLVDSAGRACIRVQAAANQFNDYIVVPPGGMNNAGTGAHWAALIEAVNSGSAALTVVGDGLAHNCDAFWMTNRPDWIGRAGGIVRTVTKRSRYTTGLALGAGATVGNIPHTLFQAPKLPAILNHSIQVLVPAVSADATNLILTWAVAPGAHTIYADVGV
jgi:hypothetical protein